jgi:zinc protease
MKVARNLRNAAGLSGGLLFFCLTASLVSARSVENSGKFIVLDNGLRVFLYEKRDLPLLHIVTGFDVGSKNETDDTNGLVHLLEHCILFRGTSVRSGAEVSSDIRRHGAYFNANTGQDLSLFEISLPAEHAEFALRNQKDILFGLDLSPIELDEEKEVLLEEYNQMEDDPHRNAVDLVLQALFAGHPYGRSVYGRREVIRKATVEGVLGFYRKYFVADNCALAVVGDFATADMERLVRDVFGPLPKTGFRFEPLPMTVPLKKSVSRRFERDVKEGYVFLGFVAPDYNHADQYAMNVLAEVLGRGINPLLPVRLRGERDSVQTVSMSYLAFRFGGAVVVSIKMDPKDTAAIQRAAVGYLKRAHNEAYSKKDFTGEAEMSAFDYLESAKNQIRFAVGQAEESGLQLAGSLARHLLLNAREKPGRYLDEIGRVDSSDLRKTAAKYLGKGEYAAVSIVPRKDKQQ